VIHGDRFLQSGLEAADEAVLGISRAQVRDPDDDPHDLLDVTLHRSTLVAPVQQVTRVHLAALRTEDPDQLLQHVLHGSEGAGTMSDLHEL
jgi:hypothetical protein